MLLAEQLLGRGERGRSARASALLADRLGDTEVGDAPAPIAIDENVLRFEVAMHDADRVRGGESAEHEIDLRRDISERARAGTRHELGYRASLGELHGVPRDVAATIPIVDRHDCRMGELCGELGFASKTRDGALVPGDVRMQEFESDLAPEAEIAHSPNGTE